MRRFLSAGAVVVAVGLATLPLETVRAQAGIRGQWTTLPTLLPINPIHVALLNTGKVLIVSGSGNLATETVYRASVWDPGTDTFATQPLTWDMFCNGMVVLPDGRVFVNGGNLQYDPFRGEPRNSVFDPATETFSDLENMAHGRWYPTVTVLGDGRVMTFSGLSETGSTNTAVEFYTVGSGWSAEYPAGWTPPLYPRMHLLPNGNVFYSGSGRGSRIFNTATRTWSAVMATTNYAATRSYGTSVLLPLTPANGYRPRVMIFGGGNPGTETTEIIDLGAATPAWQYGPPMSQPRIELNATILPSGKVLVVGGSRNDEDAATASLNADLYDPATNTFSSAGANAFPRLYHSNALLLPDATVLVNGGNPQRGNYERRQEIYSPAYLFNGDGTPAIRPVIWDVGSGALRYGGTFQVNTPNAADIASVALVRPGSPTHAFDQEQRFIGLSYTAASGVLNVTAPPNGNIAPPGYYMLFILNSAGVPSVATFVHLSSSTNQPPTATIDSPAGNVTVNPGGSVLFQGSGTDPDGTVAGYSWTFPGGNPASSSTAAAGNIVYPTPGSFVASLTVTDNEGRASTAATRTVTVADFALSATPASQSVVPGGSSSYTATVAGGAGFSGTVAFAVSGLPSGASASFAPTTVTGSGSTTLSVSTGSGTPAGSYQLTIRATSGTLTRTSTVTLVVNGDFSLSATPTSRTIASGGGTSYTVTVAGVASGSVALAVEGVPRFASARFRPNPVSGSGSSVLSVTSNKNVAAGTYNLTIRGTSGSTVRSITVTLVVQ
jgi:hypothetical protein